MKLQQPLVQLLSQLANALEALSVAQFTRPVAVLSGATIGQHTRHIVEFFIELNNGYESGIVDYGQRKRNYYIESDNRFAFQQLHAVISNLDKPDKNLLLKANYSDSTVLEGETADLGIATNYFRELVYNLEHAVHHMALIRIGVSQVSDIALPAQFGVACSTTKFRAVCVR